MRAGAALGGTAELVDEVGGMPAAVVELIEAPRAISLNRSRRVDWSG